MPDMYVYQLPAASIHLICSMEKPWQTTTINPNKRKNVENINQVHAVCCMMYDNDFRLDKMSMTMQPTGLFYSFSSLIWSFNSEFEWQRKKANTFQNWITLSFNRDIFALQYSCIMNVFGVSGMHILFRSFFSKPKPEPKRKTCNKY